MWTVRDRINLLDMLVEFAQSVRRDSPLYFKVAYTLHVMEISEWYRDFKLKKDERLGPLTPGTYS